MIAILSPAKSMNFVPADNNVPDGQPPQFLDKTKVLNDALKKFSAQEISSFMSVSENIATLNYNRFQNWSEDFSEQACIKGELNFKQAITAFTGTVYQQFALDTWMERDFIFAQKHIRILSGFYGVLQPLDYIKPYRLEMGRALETAEHKNLYSFWREELAIYFDELSLTDGPVINLASGEYAKAIDRTECEAEIIDVDFKVMKDRKLVSRGFLAKAARGAMSELIIRERLQSVEELKKLKPASFEYSESHSQKGKLVFIKRG